MDIRNLNVAMVSCYETEYGSNFIKMLTALARELRKREANVFFIFPKQSVKDYLIALESEFTIGYTRKPYAESTADLKRFFVDWGIDLVHTHFEGYDIPVAKAIKRSGRNIKQVWHLHDYLNVDKTGMSWKWLRELKTNFLMWRQYGFYGKNAHFIAVSAEVANTACHYRHNISRPLKHSNNELEAMNFEKTDVVINGIELSRLIGADRYTMPKGKFIFLSFGGEAYGKGIPTILSSGEKLAQTRGDFEIYITKGYTISRLLKILYPHNNIPKWLKIIEQTDKINTLFNQCSCYISASKYETMSMAIAESSIYGLPVIQSDIPGTWWNAKNPSTFLFKVNDTEDLTQQMKTVMDMDKSKLMSLCRETSIRNKVNLSMSLWTERIIKIYEQL